MLTSLSCGMIVFFLVPEKADYRLGTGLPVMHRGKGSRRKLMIKVRKQELCSPDCRDILKVF